MKNLILFLFVLFSALLITGCEKDDATLRPGKVDELYFGTFYGQCSGNCTTIYWLRDGDILRDTISDFYRGELELGNPASFDLLPDSLYAVANKLLREVPKKLLDHDEVIGIPDAYDQGGYYVALKDKGSYRTWRIDTNLSDVPDEIEPFLLMVREVMEELAQ